MIQIIQKTKGTSFRLLIAGPIWFLVTLLALFFHQPVLAIDHSYASYDALLKENVVVNGPESTVRYGNIQKNPQSFNQFIQEIESVTKTEYQSWTTNQKKAFLINAYNALTVQLILTKYPDLESIKDLGSFFSSPWKKKFFTLFGEKQYLDYIEHEVLRKDYADARIHFVVVCASIGCPALRNEAYVAERLDGQMDDATKLFLSDSTRNRFNAGKNQLELSSIFKWYKQDFVKSKGSVEAYVAPWITSDGAAQMRIKNQEVDLDFLDYDWSLNKADD